MKYRLRTATTDDIEAIWGLLQLMHAEIGLFPLSEKKVRARIGECLENGAVLLACDDGEIVGTAGMVPGELWYSETVMLHETWLFVHPDHRKSRHAAAMLRHAIASANEVGIPMIMAVFTTERTEAKCNLFRRKAKPIGQIFVTGLE